MLYGGVGGLSVAGDQLWHQERPRVPDPAEEGDALGFALATADFDGDAFSDLVAGVPGEEPEGGTALFTGAVNVFFGSIVGLSSAHNESWSQDSPGVLDAGEGGDQLGSSLGHR